MVCGADSSEVQGKVDRVDDQDGRPRQINADRLGLRSDEDQAALGSHDCAFRHLLQVCTDAARLLSSNSSSEAFPGPAKTNITAAASIIKSIRMLSQPPTGAGRGSFT